MEGKVVWVVADEMVREGGVGAGRRKSGWKYERGVLEEGRRR